MFKNFAFVCFLTCLSTTAFCQVNFQEGYVVKLNGDTLKGRINNLLWDESPTTIQFEGANGSQTFRPEEILAFTSGAYTSYKSFNVKIDSTGGAGSGATRNPSPTYYQTHVFLRVLLNSHASLLTFKHGFNTHFFIQLPGRTPVELLSHSYEMPVAGNMLVQKGVQYIQQLKTAFSDCSSIEVPDDLRLKDEFLVKLFTRYNDCKKLKSNIFGEEPKVKSIGAIASVGFGQYSGGFSGGIGYAGGLYYEVNYPAKLYKVSWYTEVVFESFGLQTHKGNYLNKPYVNTFKFYDVRVLTLTKSRFVYSDAGPYVLAGLGRTVGLPGTFTNNGSRQVDRIRGNWLVDLGAGLHPARRLSTEVRFEVGINAAYASLYMVINLAACYKF